MEVRTKPTMCKKTLRSALAVAFSAGLVFGALAAPALMWEDTSHRAVGTWSHAGPPPDVAWDSAPAEQVAVQDVTVRPADVSWDSVPVGMDRA